MRILILIFCVFQICNYQGAARVVVQLVTALTNNTQLHAHSLVGKQCDKGICIADLQPKDSIIRSAGTIDTVETSKTSGALSLHETQRWFCFVSVKFSEPRDPPCDEEECDQDAGGEDD